MAWKLDVKMIRRPGLDPIILARDEPDTIEIVTHPLARALVIAIFHPGVEREPLVMFAPGVLVLMVEVMERVELREIRVVFLKMMREGDKARIRRAAGDRFGPVEL